MAYRVLGKLGDAIAIDLDDKTTGHIVIVAAPTDVAAILQWRTVMGQAALLNHRTAALTSAMEVIPPFQLPTPIPKEEKAVAAVGAPFIGGPADVQTLINTAASITAVNQSFAPSTLALGDQPLINMVAAKLSATHVYVPGTYPPDLLNRSDLRGTFIGKALEDLEANRAKAVADIQIYTQAITDAKSVTTGKYKAEDLGRANEFLGHTGVLNGQITMLGYIVSAIDSFYAALITGQSAPPPSSPNASTAPTGAPGTVPPAGPAAVPAAPLTAAAAPTPQPQNAPAAAPATTPAGTTLQQILVADLLAHRIWGGKDEPTDDVLDNIRILSIHTLESGGEMLTTSNLFLGSRISFGGGVVATYVLFGSSGDVKGGGVAYGYEGPVPEKKIFCELRSGAKLEAALAGK